MPPSKNPPHGRIPSYSRLTRPRPGRRSPERPKSPRRPKHRVQTDPQCPLRRAHGCPHRQNTLFPKSGRADPPGLAYENHVHDGDLRRHPVRQSQTLRSDPRQPPRRAPGRFPHGPARGGTRFPKPPPHGDGRLFRQRRLDGCCRTRRRFGPRLRQDDEQQGPPDRHVLQHVQNAQRPARRRSVHHSQRYGAAWIRVPQEQSLRAPIPPRPRAQAPGGGHNEQKPAARGLPRRRRPENRLGHGFRLQYHFHRAARQYAPHRGHPRSGLRRAPQP